MLPSRPVSSPAIMRSNSEARRRATSQSPPRLRSAIGTTQPRSRACCNGPNTSGRAVFGADVIHDGCEGSDAPRVSARPCASNSTIVSSSGCRDTTPSIASDSNAGACVGAARKNASPSAAMPVNARSRLRNSYISRRSMPVASTRLCRRAASTRAARSCNTITARAIVITRPSSSPTVRTVRADPNGGMRWSVRILSLPQLPA